VTAETVVVAEMMEAVAETVATETDSAETDLLLLQHLFAVAAAAVAVPVKPFASAALGAVAP
jgi:xanthine/uracil permease